jgi:sulfonate transport system substrate-binding protein
MALFAFQATFVSQNRIFSKVSTFVTLSALVLTTACAPTSTTSSNSNAAPNPTPQASPSVTVTLRLGFIATGGTKAPVGPSGWALNQGILESDLKELGISKVELVSFPNGPDLNEALVSNSVDVGIYGDTPAIVARSSGVPTRLIALEQVGLNVWFVAKREGVRSLDDLRGQKVATSRGSYLHRYLLGLLQEKGLANQVEVVHLLPKDAQGALERGDIAAYAAPIGVGPLLVAKGYPLIDEAKNSPNLRGVSVIVATQPFLEKYPELPKVWNQLRQEALQQIQANPEAYYQFNADTSKLPLEAVKASYPLDQFPSEALPVVGRELLEGTKAFLVAEKLAKTDFKLSDWIFGE